MTPTQPALTYSPLRRGLIVALVVFLYDQFCKWSLVETLNNPPQQIEIFPFFKLVMVWNQGVSFGMFASDDGSRRWMLIILSLAIVAYLINWLKSVDKMSLVIAMGLIIGGAIGNVVDRLVWGAVADFFYFYYEEWFWPAFNIADSAIFIGVVILCWDSIVSGSSQQDGQA